MSSLSLSLSQGFLQQLRQIAGRMSAGGPRGAGLGIKLLIGAGALAYGVKEATYTGNTATQYWFGSYLLWVLVWATLIWQKNQADYRCWRTNICTHNGIGLSVRWRPSDCSHSGRWTEGHHLQQTWRHADGYSAGRGAAFQVSSFHLRSYSDTSLSCRFIFRVLYRFHQTKYRISFSASIFRFALQDMFNIWRRVSVTRAARMQEIEMDSVIGDNPLFHYYFQNTMVPVSDHLWHPSQTSQNFIPHRKQR